MKNKPRFYMMNVLHDQFIRRKPDALNKNIWKTTVKEINHYY